MASKPIATKTVWEQMGPPSIHAYRVTSLVSGRFIKWGTVRQLVEAEARGEVAQVIRYKRAKSLDDYFRNSGEVLDE